MLSVLLQVVFRSASAQVFLFIQISSEMWDFDPNGMKTVFMAVWGLEHGTINHLKLAQNGDN